MFIDLSFFFAIWALMLNDLVWISIDVASMFGDSALMFSDLDWTWLI